MGHTRKIFKEKSISFHYLEAFFVDLHCRVILSCWCTLLRGLATARIWLLLLHLGSFKLWNPKSHLSKIVFQHFNIICGRLGRIWMPMSIRRPKPLWHWSCIWLRLVLLIVSKRWSPTHVGTILRGSQSMVHLLRVVWVVSSSSGQPRSSASSIHKPATWTTPGHIPLIWISVVHHHRPKSILLLSRRTESVSKSGRSVSCLIFGRCWRLPMLLHVKRPALRFRLWLFGLLLFLDQILKFGNGH